MSTSDATSVLRGDDGVKTDPSRWAERLRLGAAAAVGCATAVYLAAVQIGAVAAPWDPLFGGSSSMRVLHSAFSRALPVPDAALGAAAYAVEIALTLAGGARRWHTRPRTVVASGAVAAALALGSIVLVALQVTVIRSGCLLCLFSAAISIGVASLAQREVRAAVRVLRRKVT
jgi:uncharacterized membrane protein